MSGKTGVHHHGESETALYVVSGGTRWWVGDRLDDVRVLSGRGEAGQTTRARPAMLSR